MENKISFKQLANNWYQGELTLGNKKALILGDCAKNPTEHLNAAYRFFVNGGCRAQCAFNQEQNSQLLILTRDEGVIQLEIIHLEKRFESNAKLGSMKYLDNHVAFTATIPLQCLPDALFPQMH